MSSQRRDDEVPNLRWPDEIDEIFGRANPNPQREGCPSREELIALARKQRAMTDPGYVHLTRCSPCYLQVRAVQEERLVQRRRVWVSMGVAAALMVAIGLGVWFITNRPGPASEVRAQLDLRPYAQTRSETVVDRQPLSLPRGRLTLSVILPVGFEPGTYDVQIVDSALMSRASSTGTASSENFVTTLRTIVDLTAVPTGAYQLAIRGSDGEWQLFPARVQ